MERQAGESIAVFSQRFRLSGFDELLPTGEYDRETELASPPDHLRPEAWKADRREQGRKHSTKALNDCAAPAAIQANQGEGMRSEGRLPLSDAFMLCGGTMKVKETRHDR